MFGASEKSDFFTLNENPSDAAPITGSLPREYVNSLETASPSISEVPLIVITVSSSYAVSSPMVTSVVSLNAIGSQLLI